jgi:Ca2+:H+ antiporter
MITKSLSLVYMCYLFFQLFSHKSLYEDDSPESLKPKTIEYAPDVARRLRISPARQGPASGSPPPGSDPTHSDSPTPDVNSAEAGSMEVEREDEPQMSVPMTLVLLVVITVVRR